MRKISGCRANDIIMDKTGSKCRVLARLDDLIFRSEYYRYSYAWYRPMTVFEAEEEGWRVLTPDGREEIDIKELERLMPNVKIINKK